MDSEISYNHKNGQTNLQKRTFLRTKVLTRLICIISFNIKRGFYQLGDSCSNVLRKIDIVSAAGL